MRSCSSLKMPFPAINADNLSSTFPFLQGPNGYTHLFGKRFLSQTQRLPIRTDSVGLSIIKKPVEFIQEICHRNTIELCQPLHLLRFDMLLKTFLDGFIDVMGYAHLIRHFCLKQSPAVSTPAKPIRYIVDLLVSAIPLIELGSLQDFPRRAQRKTVYEQGRISHL